MATVKRKTAQDSRPSNPVRAKVTVTSAPAVSASPDGPALTAALAEIERLREDARVMRQTHEEALRLATKHETSLERVWKWMGGR